MRQTTTDPSVIISWSHRSGRAGSKVVIFKNVDASPYDISAITFRMIIQKSVLQEDTFTLTEGSGLTKGGAGNNELTITLSETLKFTPGRYLWQLINDTTKKTWLNGPFNVHAGEFESAAGTVEVTINTESEIIEVTITDPSGGSSDVDGGTP